jgi:hypothetical protein
MVEQDDNKAAVINAALALERIGEVDQQQRGAHSLPGLQIVIMQAGSAPVQVSGSDAKPHAMTIEHE